VEIPRKMYCGSFRRNISIQPGETWKDSGEIGVGVEEKGTDDQYHSFGNCTKVASLNKKARRHLT